MFKVFIIGTGKYASIYNTYKHIHKFSIHDRSMYAISLFILLLCLYCCLWLSLIFFAKSFCGEPYYLHCIIEPSSQCHFILRTVTAAVVIKALPISRAIQSYDFFLFNTFSPFSYEISRTIGLFFSLSFILLAI